MANKRKPPTTTPTNKRGQKEPEKKGLATIGDAVAAKREERDIPREVRVENFTRRLPCKLTDAELKGKLVEIEQLKDSITTKENHLKLEEEQFKQAKKSYENQIAQDSMRREELIADVCKGVEYRDTNCQRVFNYPLIQYQEIRTDTVPPQVLIERPLNNAELQMPLDLSPKNVSTVAEIDY
jgi:hypothetical protein